MKIHVKNSTRLVGMVKIAKKLGVSPSFLSRVFHRRAKSSRIERALRRYGVWQEDGKNEN